MKLFFLLTALVVIQACATKPHLAHKLKSEKTAETCTKTGTADQFSMNSNINGERYEFKKCLPADFDKKDCLVERKGDTVLVKFPGPGSKAATFSLTLDIDAYPRYSFITIDEDTYIIATSKD